MHINPDQYHCPKSRYIYDVLYFIIPVAHTDLGIMQCEGTILFQHVNNFQLYFTSSRAFQDVEEHAKWYAEKDDTVDYEPAISLKQ